MRTLADRIAGGVGDCAGGTVLCVSTSWMGGCLGGVGGFSTQSLGGALEDCMVAQGSTPIAESRTRIAESSTPVAESKTSKADPADPPPNRALLCGTTLGLTAPKSTHCRFQNTHFRI